MAHPDRIPARPVVEPEHVDDHVKYDMKVNFTFKLSWCNYATIRWYEDGRWTLAAGGDAMRELERRNK